MNKIDFFNSFQFIHSMKLIKINYFLYLLLALSTEILFAEPVCEIEAKKRYTLDQQMLPYAAQQALNSLDHEAWIALQQAYETGESQFEDNKVAFDMLAKLPDILTDSKHILSIAERKDWAWLYWIAHFKLAENVANPLNENDNLLLAVIDDLCLDSVPPYDERKNSILTNLLRHNPNLTKTLDLYGLSVLLHSCKSNAMPIGVLGLALDYSNLNFGVKTDEDRDKWPSLLDELARPKNPTFNKIVESLKQKHNRLVQSIQAKDMKQLQMLLADKQTHAVLNVLTEDRISPFELA